MTAAQEPKPMLELLGVDTPVRLEELVDRHGLRDLVSSWTTMFGVEVRIASTSGALLAGRANPSPVLALLGEKGAEIAAEQLGRPDPAHASRPLLAPTGERFRILAIDYERRATGVFAIGPYLPEGQGEADAASAIAGVGALSAGLDRARIEEAWAKVPRFSEERIGTIAEHLATVLEVMLFSGHKALVTSQMHLASVQESYRELTDKNESLEDAYNRLKELDRLKSNFLATVSHELRTPLTSIMGYGEMLAEGLAGPLNDEQKEFVDTIRGKSEQLLGLIMSLLDLSKLESGTMAVRVARISIATVLEEAVSTLRPTAMKKGVELEVHADEELSPVLGDLDRLRQVFINLSENAIKFTPVGGRVSLSAKMSTARALNEPGLVLVAPLRPVIEVRVADTGVGVPEQEREKIFDPFYQIDQTSTREHGGAGLGLAIVKRLVDAHQGTIHVEGNDPQGAVFVVTVPAGRVSMAPPPPSRTSSIPPIFG